MQYTNIPNKPVTQTPGVFGQGDSMDRNGFYEPRGILSVPTTEIDWCGAQMDGATINSSDDLLELINNIQNEIYTLTAAVIALANK